MIALVATLLLAQAGAGSPDALFADANAAFLAGELPRAVAQYQALLDEGVVSPELETNLGAALLRQGQRGQAALHFERALFLDPSDEDARADLTELRRGNVDRLEGDDEGGGAESVARALAPLPGRAAAWGLLAAWVVGFALLGAHLLRPSKLPLLPAATAALGVAVLFGLITAGAATGHRLALARGVVVATSAPAREGPSTRSASPFEVHEGTLVRIEDAGNGFRRIRLQNGLTGWVPESAVEPVVPKAWGGRKL